MTCKGSMRNILLAITFMFMSAMSAFNYYQMTSLKLTGSWKELVAADASFMNASLYGETLRSLGLQPINRTKSETGIPPDAALEGNSTFVLGNARDEAGNWNFRLDPYLVRRRKLEELRKEKPNISTHHGVVSKLWFDSDEEREEICNSTWGKPLTGNVLRRVVLNGKEPLPEPIKETNDTAVLHQTNTSAIIPMPIRRPIDPFQSSNETGRPRVLCVIYTYENHHPLLPGIIDTYGWRYDGFFAASSKTDRDLGAVNLTKVGSESYGNMWQKTRSIVHYVHTHFVDEFDYVHIMGDDVSVIFENLQNYLMSFEEQNIAARPLFIGSICPGKRRFPIMALGGPGYILNMAAVRKFVQNPCFVGVRSSAEDRMMSNCMKRMGITLTDSTDKAHRQRMFLSSPDFVSSSYGRGYSKKVMQFLAKYHGWKWGADIVSTDSAVFHHMKPNIFKRKFHAMMYRSCPESSLLGQILSRQDAYFQDQLDIVQKHWS